MRTFTLCDIWLVFVFKLLLVKLHCMDLFFLLFQTQIEHRYGTGESVDRLITIRKYSRIVICGSFS